MTKMSKKQFKYLQALNTLDYYFEGAMIPYVLLKDTARLIKAVSNLDEVDRLEIGVLQKSLSRYAEHTLRDRFGEDWANKEHMVEGVPVYVKLINRRYGFFKFLDKVPYWGASFHIANPFDKYWKARHLVR